VKRHAIISFASGVRKKLVRVGNSARLNVEFVHLGRDVGIHVHLPKNAKWRLVSTPQCGKKWKRGNGRQDNDLPA
jgi:hypothetical protein